MPFIIVTMDSEKIHSTYAPLLELTDERHTALSNKEYANRVYLDLSKACDTVDLAVLLSIGMVLMAIFMSG